MLNILLERWAKGNIKWAEIAPYWNRLTGLMPAGNSGEEPNGMVEPSIELLEPWGAIDFLEPEPPYP